MKYIPGKTYIVKLRSLEWLKCTFKTTVRKNEVTLRNELNIWHSTGGGGGLHIKNKYKHIFGSEVKVVFKKRSRDRNIFYIAESGRMPQRLYDEWFVMGDEIEDYIPKELFEI
jgi:hypothetical protein